MRRALAPDEHGLHVIMLGVKVQAQVMTGGRA